MPRRYTIIYVDQETADTFSVTRAGDHLHVSVVGTISAPAAIATLEAAVKDLSSGMRLERVPA